MPWIAQFPSDETAHRGTFKPSGDLAWSLRDGDSPTLTCGVGLRDTRAQLRHLDAWPHAHEDRAISVDLRVQDDRSAGRTSDDADPTGANLVAIFGNLLLRNVDMLGHSAAASAASLESPRLPSLVLTGAAEPDLPDPSAGAERIAKRLGGRTVVLDGLGHDPHREAPDPVGAVLADAWRLRHAA